MVHGGSAKIDWRAKLRLSILNYEQPPGYSEQDYVIYKYHALIANMLLENQQKIKKLAEDLHINTSSDFALKIVIGVVSGLGML